MASMSVHLHVTGTPQLEVARNPLSAGIINIVVADTMAPVEDRTEVRLAMPEEAARRLCEALGNVLTNGEGARPVGLGGA